MYISHEDMLNYIVDTQFNESFTKEEIEKMSPDEIAIIKFKIRTTFMLSLDEDTSTKQVSNLVASNFNKQIVEGEFYPDNYIGDKKVSTR